MARIDFCHLWSICRGCPQDVEHTILEYIAIQVCDFPQLVNEEEPAQASQEAPAQDAPPPYSSIAAANAG